MQIPAETPCILLVLYPEMSSEDLHACLSTYVSIQGVSGGIVNILGGGSRESSE